MFKSRVCEYRVSLVRLYNLLSNLVQLSVYGVRVFNLIQFLSACHCQHLFWMWLQFWEWLYNAQSTPEGKFSLLLFLDLSPTFWPQHRGKHVFCFNCGVRVLSTHSKLQLCLRTVTPTFLLIAPFARIKRISQNSIQRTHLYYCFYCYDHFSVLYILYNL